MAETDKQIIAAAIEQAYKEGFTTGYADGINADESCVPETTYFKNDFAKAWEKSDTKAAIAKAQPSNTSVQPKKSGVIR